MMLCYVSKTFKTTNHRIILTNGVLHGVVTFFHVPIGIYLNQNQNLTIFGMLLSIKSDQSTTTQTFIEAGE